MLQPSSVWNPAMDGINEDLSSTPSSILPVQQQQQDAATPFSGDQGVSGTQTSEAENIDIVQDLLGRAKHNSVSRQLADFSQQQCTRNVERNLVEDMPRSKSVQVVQTRKTISTIRSQTKQLMQITDESHAKELRQSHSQKAPVPRKKIVPREFELMPDFLDQIGRDCFDINFNFAQFSRDLAAGLISKFYNFQNVFKPDAYEVKNAKKCRKKPQNMYKINYTTKDRHEQIKDLHFCTAACYPSIEKPREEIELDNFAKQIVSTMNQVLQNSSAAQAANQAHQTADPALATVRQISQYSGCNQMKQADINSNTTSTLGGPSQLNLASGGIPAGLMAANANFLEVKGLSINQRMEALKDEIAALKQKVEDKEVFINKQRKDFTRDLQNLRNALVLAIDPINREHAEKVKLTINVHNFNDMEGLPKELVEFFNERITIVKEQAQLEIDKVTQNVHQLVQRIEKYKSLKPQNYGLMDMSLSEVFEGVSVIEPKAFPVWQAMISAFPPHHFTAIIKQVAEQLSEHQDNTYAKLLEMVNSGILQGTKNMEAMVERCRDRNKTQFTELCELRGEFDQEKWKCQHLLEEQEKRIAQQNKQLMEKERKLWQEKKAQELRKMQMKIDYYKGEVKRQKRSRDYLDMKVCLFKWRQAGILARFIDELNAEYLDKDSLRDLFQQDMRKLFLGMELHLTAQSVEYSKTITKELENKLQVSSDENYQLRLKINHLLQERQNILSKMERYRVRESDLMHQYDKEHQMRLDSQMASKAAQLNCEQLAEQLKRQIEYKEMFEDKLRDTLDQNNLLPGTQVGDVNEVRRQKQTKRILEGFRIEMNSLFIEKEQALGNKIRTTFDIQYGETQTSQACQTEIQNVSKNLELVVLHSKPFVFQSTRVPLIECSAQTDVTTSIVDFMARGAQKYERLMQLGHIMPDFGKQSFDKRTVAAYVEELINLNQKDLHLFNKRMQNLNEIPKLKVQHISPQESSRKSKNKKDDGRNIKSMVNVNKITLSQMQLKSTETSRADRLLSGQQSSNRHATPLGEHDKAKGQNGESDSESRMNKIRLAPLLDQQNADLSSSEVDLESQDQNSGAMTSLRERQTVAHLNLAPGQTDFRELAERKNAVTLFDCYIDIFETMIEMEPKLFKDAVKTIKKHKSFKLDMKKIKSLKSLYPDLVPDVFTRLWKQEYEPMELKHRQTMFREAKLAWRKRLRDQGRLDNDAELEDQKQQQQQNNFNFGGSETVTQTQDASMPYLSPMNIPTLPDCTPMKYECESQPITDRKTRHRSPRSTKIGKKKLKKAILESTQTDQFNNRDSVVNIEPAAILKHASSIANSSENQLQQQYQQQRELCQKPQQLGVSAQGGVFSLPKSVHEMRVSILPKGAKVPNSSNLHSSVQIVSEAADCRQAGGELMNTISPQFSMQGRSKHVTTKATTAPSTIPRVKETTIVSRSHRLATRVAHTKKGSSASSRQPVFISVQQTAPAKAVTLTVNRNGSQVSPIRQEDSEEQVLFSVPEQAAYKNQLRMQTLPQSLTQRIVVGTHQSMEVGQPVMNITSGEQHVSRTSLQQSRIVKPKRERPQTCKVKQLNKRGKIRAISASGPNSKHEKYTSQDASSTLQDTFVSQRPASGSGQTAPTMGFNQQRPSMMIGQSIHSLHRQTPANKACPVKAFDMHGIPMNQHEKMRNSLLMNFKSGPSNYATMSAVLETQNEGNAKARRKPFQRAQSATHGKNAIKHVINNYDSGYQQAASGDLSRVLLKSIPQNASSATNNVNWQLAGKGSLNVSKQINESSENDLKLKQNLRTFDHTTGSNIPPEDSARQLMLTTNQTIQQLKASTLENPVLTDYRDSNAANAFDATISHEDITKFKQNRALININDQSEAQKT